MSEIRIRSFQPGQVTQWLSCGWRLLRKRPLEALVPAAVFALAVPGLRAVPIIGDIALLLLLPTVITSYLLHVHLIALTGNAPRARRNGATPAWRRLARDLRQALFGAWAKTENIFPLLLVGLVLVLLGLLIHLQFNLIGGQSVISPYGFLELTGMQMLRMLLAYGAAAGLWILILAPVTWMLPLFALRDMALLEAFGWGLRALVRNVAVVVVLLAVLAAGLVPALMVKLVSPLAQLGALWLTLTVLAALFGFSAYCSYRLVFAEAAPEPRPAAPPHPAAAPARRS